jgi:hypothetical protein
MLFSLSFFYTFGVAREIEVSGAEEEKATDDTSREGGFHCRGEGESGCFLALLSPDGKTSKISSSLLEPNDHIRREDSCISRHLG